MDQRSGQSSGRAGDDGGITPVAERPNGRFDGYDMVDVPLGDLLRGERATLGKSLLDVERELKIRAAYIASIENGDVGAFSSPGFIAGYVRSYARYLGIDAEWTFQRFCDETGFQGVHGTSARQAKDAKRRPAAPPRRLDPNDVMSAARISFAPERERMFSGLEPGALGSVAVLLVLVAGLGYGAWAVLHDIQRLQIAPVDDAPAPLAQLDPLQGASDNGFDVAQGSDIRVPTLNETDQLFRPQTLDAPRLTPRDGALASLDPDATGTLAGGAQGAGGSRISSAIGTNSIAAATPDPVEPAAVQVTEAQVDEVMIFAVRPSWVRVSAASGDVLFEGTLNAGDSYTLPQGETAPQLRAGNAGSLYFAVNGVTLGPSGPGTSIARNVILTADALSESYNLADPTADPDLSEVATLVLGGPDAE